MRYQPITIPDDVQQSIESYADLHHITPVEALKELVNRGMESNLSNPERKPIDWEHYKQIAPFGMLFEDTPEVLDDIHNRLQERRLKGE